MRKELKSFVMMLSLLGVNATSQADPTSSPVAKPGSGFRILGGMDNDLPTESSPVAAVLLPAPEQSEFTHIDISHREVEFKTDLKPGSILIRTAERKLYYILGNDRAVLYYVGVGREGFTWSGRNLITRKAEWPDWRPPQEMIAREKAKGKMIPAHMPGGPANPLGARALYIGDTEYRIHGTNDPASIGRAMSSGCIRMMNSEIIDLYARVAIGAEAVVE